MTEQEDFTRTIMALINNNKSTTGNANKIKTAGRKIYNESGFTKLGMLMADVGSMIETQVSQKRANRRMSVSSIIDGMYNIKSIVMDQGAIDFEVLIG